MKLCKFVKANVKNREDDLEEVLFEELLKNYMDNK